MVGQESKFFSFRYIVEIEPEVEIKSTESYHIQKTYVKNTNDNADSSSQNQFGKFRNEYDTTQNENKDKNNDPFRKNKSTVYGTPKNQRRNTKGTFMYIKVRNLHFLDYHLIYQKLLRII